MQAGAPNIACLLIGRIVAGVAIGILSMVVPLYNVRTRLSTLEGKVADPSRADRNCATKNSRLHCRFGTADDRFWIHHCELGSSYTTLSMKRI